MLWWGRGWGHCIPQFRESPPDLSGGSGPGERCGPGARSPDPRAFRPAFPDYAEALINPIKHVSLMDQRAKQLAALIGESEVSPWCWVGEVWPA